MITVTDLFCGAGGSGQGALAVPGVELAYAANHWLLAIKTHEANFPNTRHDHVNISQAEPRRYRRTNILWASPECTNHSQAKGQKRVDNQPDLFGEILPDEAATRSRATMWDVPRFAEVHRYDAVIVENVVDAAKWVMFQAWLAAMVALGYRYEIVYLNSMHAPAEKTPRAPQSRDRMYVVFTKVGNRKPMLDIRPLAWCQTCETVVAAVQTWKRPDYRWGRYRAQYVYRCPSKKCRFSIVEPYADPAATAIDWTMPGIRIGDRAKALSPKTIARIEAGLRRYAGKPMTFEARGNTFARVRKSDGEMYARAWPTDEPTATLTASETRALIVPVEGRAALDRVGTSDTPFRTQNSRAETGLLIPAGGTWNDTADTTDRPMRARTAQETDALVIPYYGTGVAHSTDRPLPTMTTVDTAGIAFVAELRGGHSVAHHVTDPLATVTASGNHHMLVRHNTSKGDGGEMCTPATEPARTITTKGHQSIVGWPGDVPDVNDCTFRMLEPSEIQAAMAFHDTYDVLGNRREKVRQLGNGVTPPAAEWLIRAVVDSLEGTAA